MKSAPFDPRAKHQDGRDDGPGVVGSDEEAGVDFEVLTCGSGDRLWVNGPDGSSLGRFSRRFGIDVHTPAAVQLAGGKECLCCTHAPAGAAEWALFRQAMHEHHGIELDEGLMTFADGLSAERQRFG